MEYCQFLRYINLRYRRHFLLHTCPFPAPSIHSCPCVRYDHMTIDQGTTVPQGHARHHPTLAQFMPRQPPTTKTVACGDDFGDIVVQLISQPRPPISGLSIRTNSASSSSRGSWSLGGGCRCLGSHITPPCMVQPGYPRLPPQLPPPLPPSCILPWNARHNQDKAMY